MNYEEKMTEISVLGAAGKMGSGILYLVAVEATELSLLENNGSRNVVVNAIDIAEDQLNGLRKYIQTLVKKYAEKKAVKLRKIYANRNDLIENEEIIDQFCDDVLKNIRFTNLFEAAYNSKLIFEAIIENPKIKIDIFKQIDSHNKLAPWFFTNTSSIPINELDAGAGLDGRIVGFHFYNPPPVQRLVELIQTKNVQPELVDFSKEFAKRIGKLIVPSNDIAGFIGNGFFMRDILYGFEEYDKLLDKYSSAEALLIINEVTNRFLVRPMGIFQLVDYVGVDVCKFIMQVMNPYFEEENLHCNFLGKMFDLGIKGGQFSNGSQKEGLFQYEKGAISAVYDIDKKEYVELETISAKIKTELGELPDEKISWGSMRRIKNKEEVLGEYFEKLSRMETTGAELANTYLAKCKSIGELLVENGTAKSADDVNKVMMNGFYHIYGPINSFIAEEV